MTSSTVDWRDIIQSAIAEGDAVGAQSAARALWDSAPNASTARYVLARQAELWRNNQPIEHRMAVLRSYTVEPILPLLQAEAALSGCQLATHVGEFNAYAQEILDSSSELYRFKPDTIILAVQTRDIAPDLWGRFADLDDDTIAERVNEVAGEMGGLLAQLRAKTSAHLLVHTLETPVTPTDGMLGMRRPLTQNEAIGLINRGLRERVMNLSDAHLLDVEALQARYGRARFLNERKWATAKLPFSADALAWMAAEWWRHLSMVALPQAKVLALDLDNTLWGGVLGEEGIAGIRLGSEHPGAHFSNFQRAILDIARRGILLVLVSKNNWSDVQQVFDDHPDMLLKQNDFTAVRVNWEPKVNNLISLAEELNLGLDAFVFLDDNPVEREAVRRSLPQVAVPELSEDPSTYADMLRLLPTLERLHASAEDLERSKLYAQERSRQAARAEVESLEEFLGSLDIRVEVEQIDALTLGRAAQLTLKTNQLNMTTRRYTESQLRERLSNPTCLGYVLRSADRFGDNGIVGVTIVDILDQTLDIDTLLLSCRVIGRQIETALLAFLSRSARSMGVHAIQGWYIPTSKNAPARAVYKTAGFVAAAENGSTELWRFDLRSGEVELPPWIELSTDGPPSLTLD